ncbi:MAG TPA: coproporphyrinogen-III oxidase family protein [Bacteroidales bacterium]|nr:coproporphyrinogen-III oxidase family protein [Bacteroidales bacterium]HRZ50253.1 coproporphyrinogen-III oxidase family protein [Bacteroidales bacterium]
MISEIIRKQISRKFTGLPELKFENVVPDVETVHKNLQELNTIGLYLHIPFCHQICPYCPYNKEIFSDDAAQQYTHAVIQEVQKYSALMAGKKISSFYIGGGTPTTMLGKGLEQMLEAVYRHFNMECAIHIESHPNHLSDENLNALKALGVNYLSVGVEALQDRHLKVLERPYTSAGVKKIIERAAGKNFECLNIDYIFDLPGQTCDEVEEAVHEMIRLGIHQAATYPLFHFPYTRFGKDTTLHRNAVATMFRRRKFLKIIEGIFYSSGFERSSVWAFTQKGTEKYCSVTVPSYLGIGASGGSYLRDIFYVNTFNVAAYVKAAKNGRLPVALSIGLSEKAQMAGWLYWRIYETKFRKSDFSDRFGLSFDKEYGAFMKMLDFMGFLDDNNSIVRLTDKGTYWIHAFEDFFSIDYINKLWGTSRENSWPEEVIL